MYSKHNMRELCIYTCTCANARRCITHVHPSSGSVLCSKTQITFKIQMWLQSNLLYQGRGLASIHKRFLGLPRYPGFWTIQVAKRERTHRLGDLQLYIGATVHSFKLSASLNIQHIWCSTDDGHILQQSTHWKILHLVRWCSQQWTCIYSGFSS